MQTTSKNTTDTEDINTHENSHLKYQSNNLPTTLLVYYTTQIQ